MTDETTTESTTELVPVADKAPEETKAPETLLDRVVAARSVVEAKYPHQMQSGSPLNETQQAEILIAQVQAILAGEPEDEA